MYLLRTLSKNMEILLITCIGWRLDLFSFQKAKTRISILDPKHIEMVLEWSREGSRKMKERKKERELWLFEIGDSSESSNSPFPLIN